MSVATVIPTMKHALLPAESATLQRLEGVIRRGFKAWIEVGEALSEIREKRLYRATHKTFEDYCRDRWDMSRQAASRMIAGLSVVKDLSTRDDKTEDEPIVPETPWAAQPLVRLEPEQRREAWDKAVEDADGNAPTHDQVEAAAEQVAPRSEPADVARSRARGTIPANAEVIVKEEAGDDEEEAEDAGPEEESDEAWLATLPARARLSNDARRWFDAEALAFRHVAQIRREYRDRCKRHTSRAKKEGRHIGPWLSLHDFYLRQADPSRWIACLTCLGTGRLDLVGKCPACKGHAYHVSGGEVVADAD